MPHTIRVVRSDGDLIGVRRLLAEYGELLTTDAGVVAGAVRELFERELSSLPGPYAPPAGCILLATVGEEPAGCVALRPFEPPAVAEMKRLYVRAAHHSSGLGRALVEAVLDEGRARGYERIRLDTLPTMHRAERLYRSLGFRDIAPFGVNQVPGAVFLERSLSESSRSGCMPFHVRKATPGDADGILVCLAAAFAPFRDQYTPDAYVDTVLTPDSLRRRLEAMTLFVAIADAVIGTIGAEVVGGGEGHLRGMAVAPTWHGCGVADALLNAALAELRERGCTRVRLDTTAPLERAIHFYQSRGFRATGRVDDFFGMPLYEYVRELAERPSLA